MRKTIIAVVMSLMLTMPVMAAEPVSGAVQIGIAPGQEETVSNPYSGIQISDSEFEELRWVIALEAGSSLEDKMAVCEAILNRCISANDWGQYSDEGAVHGVLSKKGQFATYKYIGSSKAWNTPGELEDDAISEVLRVGPSVLPSTKYVYFDSKGGVNGRKHVKIKGGNTYGAEK